MSLQSKKVLISGRVQGVGFRYFTRVTAKSLGVKGWVRNRGDGSVETVIQGQPGQIEDMIEKLREGPSAARVDDVDVRDLNADEIFSVFEVRR
jgi:acylphosphatase